MRLLKFVFALLPLFLLVPAVLAGDAGNVVLDQYDSWRMFSVLKPPEIALDDGVKVAEYKYNDNYWLNGETSQPPADWTQPEFDDAQWLEGPVGMECRAPFVSRLCFRGKFFAMDPAQVKSLTLSVSYQGGVVVYFNGEEVARQHLPQGAAWRRPTPLRPSRGRMGPCWSPRDASSCSPAIMARSVLIW